MTSILLSQRDPQWAAKSLGTSSVTIGQGGCTITCVGMKFGITPDKVNDLLNAVNGFAPSNPSDPFQPEKNLIIWKKLEEALPGVTFVSRNTPYNNDIVLQNIPCLVEVNAAPIGGTRHWVLYIGNHRIYDPWDGKEKGTDAYDALSFVVLSGEYKEVQAAVTPVQEVAPVVEPTVPVTPEEPSEKMWTDAEYQACLTDRANFWKARDAALKKLQEIQDQFNDLNTKYSAFAAVGYNTTDDVNKALKEKDTTILALQQENTNIRKRNSDLAGIVQQIEEEDHVSSELGQKALDENARLKETLSDVAQATGIKDFSVKNIVTSVFGLRDLADKYLQKLAEEQGKTKAVKSDNVQSVTSPGITWLMNMLQLVSTKDKGVK